MNIKDILINDNESIKKAMNIIDNGGLSIAIVVDKKEKFSGVITSGDIRNAILNGTNLDEKTGNVMNKSPLRILDSWPKEKIEKYLQTDEIKEKILKNKTMRIPILDKKENVVNILIVNDDGSKNYLISENNIDNNIIKPIKKVLIVGGAGYLGSILSKKLLDKGYYVRVLDNLTYGDHGIKTLKKNEKFELLIGDMRDIQTIVKAVWDVDAVIHLAAIVGDPASAINPIKTIEINYFATKMLAEVCKYSQINRFIFASTCSVYGANIKPDIRINEESELNPISLYAEMKRKSEEALLEIADENFRPTILRMATLYGLSPRMRFDLVVNILTIKAIKEGKFAIFGGDQWRPLLHIKDAANAYITCLEQPLNKSGSEIFNVGSNEENYKIIDVGRKVKRIVPDAAMEIDDSNIDKRDYNVSFNKINNILDFTTKYTVDDGVEEIKNSIEKGLFDDYPNKIYSNYTYLINNQE